MLNLRVPTAYAPAKRRRKRIWLVVLVVLTIVTFTGVSMAMALGIHVFNVPTLPSASAVLFGDKSAGAERLNVKDVTVQASSEIIDIAKSGLTGNAYGLNSKHGQCLGFVDDVFAAWGQDFRRVCCATYAMKMADPISYDLTRIPVGACVFSNRSVSHVTCENCGKDAGHIGIYAGNNQVIHNGEAGVELIDINDFIRKWGQAGAGGSIGWGWHAGIKL